LELRAEFRRPLSWKRCLRFLESRSGHDLLDRALQGRGPEARRGAVVRTNQLNTTGYTYSYEELDAFRQSASHQLLVSSLEDKHGAYGKIGLTLIEMGEGTSSSC
jgi:hypothetical protein